MQRDPDRPAHVRVERVVDETPTARTLAFRDPAMEAALPGQFAMVWVPGAGELPMSVMAWPEPGMAAFTVRRHGPASTALYGVPEGGSVGVRGPYGRPFDVLPGSKLLVGGGTGAVPLMRLLTRLPPGDEATVVLGARSAGEVLFERMAARLKPGAPPRVVVATDDGSAGSAGSAADAAEAELAAGGAGAVYTCGPEPMMARVVRAAAAAGVPSQAALERVMKCGVGMCGSCCAGEDLVCVDGPAFGGERLAANPDFGRSYRDKSGAARRY